MINFGHPFDRNAELNQIMDLIPVEVRGQTGTVATAVAAYIDHLKSQRTTSEREMDAARERVKLMQELASAKRRIAGLTDEVEDLKTKNAVLVEVAPEALNSVENERLREALELFGVGFDPDWGWCSGTAETVHPDPLTAAKAEAEALFSKVDQMASQIEAFLTEQHVQAWTNGK